MKNGFSGTWLAIAAVFLLSTGAGAADTWSSRSRDLQNTGNAGHQPGLTFDNVKDLDVVDFFDTDGTVNATPVLVDGLMITGDWKGFVYVVDVTTNPAKELLKIQTRAKPSSGGKDTTDTGTVVDQTGAGHLGNEFGDYSGMQSTPAIGSVTLPDQSEDLRAYVAVISNRNTLWCLSLSKVLDDIDTLRSAPASYDPGDPNADPAIPESGTTQYFCDGGAFPRSLSALGFGEGTGTMNGAPHVSPDQPIIVNGQEEIRDVLFTPTTGIDCNDGRMWALDAYTGELLWDFDPVPGGVGGSIWTTPAVSADKSMVYVTTGDCVARPQSGAKAEAVVALNAKTGAVEWFHQKRLFDAADLDIGCGAMVADVPGFQGCNVVISTDKDGCIHAYDQKPNIPDIGEPGHDLLRPGQQRLRWQKCFVGGTLNGGFNASNPALWGRTLVQQTSGYPLSHIGADDANAFAVDACTGQLQWASSDVSNGRTDAAIASDMLFQIGNTRKLAGVTDYPYQWVQEVTVVAMDAGLSRIPEVLATLKLPAQGALGGGGIAIADSRLYIPTVDGVAIAAVVPNGGTSEPVRRGLNVFAGPYPFPMAPGAAGQTAATFDPNDPYPLMLRKPGAPEAFRSLTEGGPQGNLPDGVLPE